MAFHRKAKPLRADGTSARVAASWMDGSATRRDNAMANSSGWFPGAGWRRVAKPEGINHESGRAKIDRGWYGQRSRTTWGLNFAMEPARTGPRMLGLALRPPLMLAS